MNHEELRDGSRQLARREPDAILSADLNAPLPDETTNNYESLACQVCGVDLLETRWGNFVWAANTTQAATPRYVDFHWVCKGQCDKFVQAVLRDEGYWAPWADIEDLKNPLEHKRWIEVTSRQIERGEISETAAAKISEVLRITAPIADREPTPEDIARFREILMVSGL